MSTIHVGYLIQTVPCKGSEFLVRLTLANTWTLDNGDLHPFTYPELERALPQLSRTTICRVIQKMKREGILVQRSVELVESRWKGGLVPVFRWGDDAFAGLPAQGETDLPETE